MTLSLSTNSGQHVSLGNCVDFIDSKSPQHYCPRLLTCRGTPLFIWRWLKMPRGSSRGRRKRLCRRPCVSLDFPRTTSPTRTYENKSSDASLAARNRRHHRSLLRPVGRVPRCDYRYLCDAFASYTAINLLNNRAGLNVRDKMIQKLAATLGTTQPSEEWRR